MKKKIITFIICIVCSFIPHNNNNTYNTKYIKLHLTTPKDKIMIDNSPKIKYPKISEVKKVKKPKSKFDIKMTQKDLQYLYQCVETETYGADMKSKSHIVSVIFNRYKSKKFGNTITEIITSPNQFAYFRTDISKSTKKAVEYVMEHGDTTQGAIYFHSYNDAMSSFNNANYIFIDKVGHHFYK